MENYFESSESTIISVGINSTIKLLYTRHMHTGKYFNTKKKGRQYVKSNKSYISYNSKFSSKEKKIARKGEKYS